MSETPPDEPKPKSSFPKELIMGLFLVVVFPTLAVLVQRHLAGQADQNQKQSQPTNVAITIHQPSSTEVSKTSESRTDKRDTDKEEPVIRIAPTVASDPPPSAVGVSNQPASSPTLEQVNKDPQKYVSQRLVFDDLHLLGPADNRPPHFRFTVKTPQGSTFTTEHSDTQRIIFVSFNKVKQVKALASAMKTGADIRVRMTCQIAQGQSDQRFLARVVRIDLIRFGPSAIPVLETITAEQLNQQVATFVGKTVVLDNVSLTGTTKDMRVRIALEVKSPAGTVFETALKGNQGFLFAIPVKNEPAKRYIDNALTGDRARRLRVIAEILKLGDKAIRADIKRLDAVAYDYDRPVTLDASVLAWSDLNAPKTKAVPSAASPNTGKADAKTKTAGKN